MLYRERTPNRKSQLLFDIAAHKHFLNGLGKCAFRDGIGIDFIQKGCVASADDRIFPRNLISFVELVIECAIAGNHLYFGARCNQFGVRIADIFEHDMPVSILLFGL